MIYLLPIAVEAIPWGTRAASSQLVTLVTYVKYLNSDLIINIWKKNIEMEREEKEIVWIKVSKQKVEMWSFAKSIQVFIRCM